VSSIVLAEEGSQSAAPSESQNRPSKVSVQDEEARRARPPTPPAAPQRSWECGPFTLCGIIPRNRAQASAFFLTAQAPCTCCGPPPRPTLPPCRAAWPILLLGATPALYATYIKCNRIHGAGASAPHLSSLSLSQRGQTLMNLVKAQEHLGRARPQHGVDAQAVRQKLLQVLWRTLLEDSKKSLSSRTPLANVTSAPPPPYLGHLQLSTVPKLSLGALQIKGRERIAGARRQDLPHDDPEAEDVRLGIVALALQNL
jgi:hypothetical protein